MDGYGSGAPPQAFDESEADTSGSAIAPILLRSGCGSHSRISRVEYSSMTEARIFETLSWTGAFEVYHDSGTAALICRQNRIVQFVRVKAQEASLVCGSYM